MNSKSKLVTITKQELIKKGKESLEDRLRLDTNERRYEKEGDLEVLTNITVADSRAMKVAGKEKNALVTHITREHETEGQGSLHF